MSTNIQEALDRLSEGIQKHLDEIANGTDMLSMGLIALGYDEEYIRNLAQEYLTGDNDE